MDIISSLIEAGKGISLDLKVKNVDVPWGHQVQLCPLLHVILLYFVLLHVCISTDFISSRQNPSVTYLT